MSSYQEDFDTKAKQYQQLLSLDLPLSCSFRTDLVIKLVTGKISMDKAREEAKKYYKEELAIRVDVPVSIKYNSRSVSQQERHLFNVCGLIKDKNNKRYAVFLVAPDGFYHYETYTNFKEHLNTRWYVINNIKYVNKKMQFTTPVKEFVYGNEDFNKTLKCINSFSYNLGDSL